MGTEMLRILDRIEKDQGKRNVYYCRVEILLIIKGKN